METLPQTKFLKLRSLGKKKPNIHGKLDNYCSIARHACACVLSLNFCIPVSTVFIQSMEMQGFGGNTVKKKNQVLPGLFLSICSASVAVIWETVVNTWAQCTDARSIQYRW